jgi:hypothetical protein
VRLQADVLFDVQPGRRHIARRRVFARLREVLLDRVAHQIGLQGSLPFRP